VNRIRVTLSISVDLIFFFVKGLLFDVIRGTRPVHPSFGVSGSNLIGRRCTSSMHLKSVITADARQHMNY
jgi:hypothetical protein